MTITIGYWIIPLLITIISFILALWPQSNSGNDYGASGVISLLFLSGAVILSLVSWLIWALLIKF